MLGLAHGWLRTSRAFRDNAPALDADADGNPDFGYLAGGAERQTELYYNWRLNDHFLVSPDVQWVQRPGGDAATRDMLIWGIRLKAAF